MPSGFNATIHSWDHITNTHKHTELKQLDKKNSIKYCLVMGDPKLKFVTARYINDILSSYDIENKSRMGNKYIKIFMF